MRSKTALHLNIRLSHDYILFKDGCVLVWIGGEVVLMFSGKGIIRAVQRRRAQEFESTVPLVSEDLTPLAKQ